MAPADTTTTAKRRTYTVDEAAALLGIGRNATYDAIHRGEIPALKIGRRLVIPCAAFDRLLDIGPGDQSAA